MKRLLTACIASIICLHGMTNVHSNFKKSANRPINIAKEFAASVMQLWPDSFAVKSGVKSSWMYDQGVILLGIDHLWNATGDVQYFEYMQHKMDYYVKEDGSIYDFKSEDFNLDHLNNGKILLTLYQVTGKEKYKKAIDQLHNQLLNQPRNSLGGFWHNKSYPNQIGLDGLYKGAAFHAQWASVFHDTLAFNDITRQFVLVEKYTRNNKSGLFYHAWDETKSSHILAQSMGWYGMALVDALDYYPENHPGKDTLIQILQRWSTAILKVQDPKDGLWYAILDVPNDPRNYKEASASSMFTFTLLKAIRKGYINHVYLNQAKKAYTGLLANFVSIEKGELNLKGTVNFSGLEDNPNQDGSLDAYFKEPSVVNDPKGMGAFLQATVEAEFNHQKVMRSLDAKPPVVLLDAFYNNETKKDAYGRDARWHYAWEDISNGGFGMIGKQFESKGAKLKTLLTAPTALDLKNTSVYLIVDPDNLKDNPKPNYMNSSDASVISNWVNEGGVLILFANDSANCDLVHFNILSEKFGIQFTNESINMVKGVEYEMGAAYPVQPNEVLKFGTKIFVKDISAIKLTGAAKAIAVSNEQVVAAIASYGKGKVIAIGDPWLYNEYVDGRKLPKSFQNFEAMQQLVNWTLSN
jgi:unsaturated rhamnogalacturonyl hydrolase